MREEIIDIAGTLGQGLAVAIVLGVFAAICTRVFQLTLTLIS